MISHQTTHSLKTLKKLGILLKLDHSNAFDKLNWNCLFQILHTSSFDHEWISLTKTLISSAFYSIALNGSPHINPFVASSRIWHVDPLSLSRFILAIEGLGRSFKAMIFEKKNNIKGSCSFGEDLPLPHQQFVDDTMCMGIPTIHEV